MSEKIEVQNFTSPDHIYRVDKGKYTAMRDAVLNHMPTAEPGATPAQLIAAVKPDLPQDLFPGGEKAGWWFKCVQLDLEAKGVLKRAEKPPVRLHKV
ncbi:DUF6958 family protein [Pelagibacterium luteolum]|uniref:Uncharacterized protein n=1 Tax=Pelagibacterium luteolum TaxID=440168 RepID=A0A1G7VMQ6_9HYPH|nr:hypothetical protein [Pelagibacterium luteolum]SDG60709.1 hypothetical protein SAMN04487974_104214 [Pelagibacterium luteolum]